MSAKRDSVVFTIVQNEHRFLPVWLEHYSKQFDRQDIYVLDHDSDYIVDPSIGFKYVRVPVHRSESFDHEWLRDTVSLFQKFLLQSYRCVLFTEADEIVAPVSPFASLRSYISNFLEGRHLAARCQGFEIVHDIESEPPIDWSKRPLLDQRSWWSGSSLYSKVLLSKVALDWSHGFHTVHNLAKEIVDQAGPMLIHLHRLDYDYCLHKHKGHAAKKWSSTDLAEGRGFQNRIVEPDAFDSWFYHPERNGLEELHVCSIPHEVRQIL